MSKQSFCTSALAEVSYELGSVLYVFTMPPTCVLEWIHIL